MSNGLLSILVLVLCLAQLGPLAMALWPHVKAALSWLGEWWRGYSVGLVVGVVLATLLPAGLPSIQWPSILPSIVDVTPSGPRKVLLVYESQNASPQFKGLLVSLRGGEFDAHFKSKQHELTVLDLDAKDASGQPTSAVKAWQEAFPGRQIPALVMADSAGKVVHSEVLTDAATAASILASVKAHE